MIYLFTAAHDNIAYLESAFEKLLASVTESGIVGPEQFATHVQNKGYISISMRQSVLISFFSLGQHQNIYEWAEYRARKGGRDVTAVLQEELGRYYERRIVFDSFFDNGRQFRYGALSIGGLGPTDYGDFATCLRDDIIAAQRDVAYLQADSLNTYLLPGPAVDDAALRADLAPHCHRHILATLKFGLVICAKAELLWPALLCSNDDYVEAIFTKAIAPTDVDRVKFGRSEHDRLYDLAFNDFRRPLSKVDRLLVDGFVLLLQKLGVQNSIRGDRWRLNSLLSPQRMGGPLSNKTMRFCWFGRLTSNRTSHPPRSGW